MDCSCTASSQTLLSDGRDEFLPDVRRQPMAARNLIRLAGSLLACKPRTFSWLTERGTADGRAPFAGLGIGPRSPPAIPSALTWVGRDMAATAPIAEQAALSALQATARTLGPTTRWATLIYSSGASTIRWPSSSWRCGSIRTSRWRMVLTDDAGRLLATGKECDLAARHVLRRSRAILSRRSIAPSSPMQNLVGRTHDEAIRLSRQGVRLRSDFVGAHRY